MNSFNLIKNNGFIQKIPVFLIQTSVNYFILKAVELKNFLNILNLI